MKLEAIFQSLINRQYDKQIDILSKPPEKFTPKQKEVLRKAWKTLPPKPRA